MMEEQEDYDFLGRSLTGSGLNWWSVKTSERVYSIGNVPTLIFLVLIY